MIRVLKENRLFLSLCMLWFAASGIPLLFTGKGAFSLWLNNLHTPFLDIFFRYATWLGDGNVIIIICFLLFFVKYRYAIVTSLVSFTSAWFISLIKHSVDEERPSLFFKNMSVHYVDGVELYQRMSFPSGHTAAAFTLFFLFMIFTADKKYAWLYFALAVTAALSRVYLMQHFLVDVFFGSFFGILFTLILYTLLMATPLFKNKQWCEGSLVTLLQKRKRSN